MLLTRWMFDVFMAAILFAVWSDAHPTAATSSPTAAARVTQARTCRIAVIIFSVLGNPVWGRRTRPRPCNRGRGKSPDRGLLVVVDARPVVPPAEPVQDAGVVAVAQVPAVADRHPQAADRPVPEDRVEDPGVGR